jgi:hypothetical protein
VPGRDLLRWLGRQFPDVTITPPSGTASCMAGAASGTPTLVTPEVDTRADLVPLAPLHPAT